MIPHVAQTSRGSFAYFERGEGPLVLFLHGFPDSPHAWLPVMERFSGYRCIAPFLRGYAPSVLGGPYDLDSLAADVRAIADALSADRFALVGHDWGAVITYAAARVMPQRITAAVAMSVPHPLSFVRALASNAAQLRRSWYMAFFQLRGIADRKVAANNYAFIDRLFAAWSPALTNPHLEDVKRALTPAALEYYRAMVSPRGVRDARSPIRVPLLHLTGSDDGCIGPEVGRGQHRYFSGPFASEVLEGAGHFLHWEQPGLIADRARAWITTNERL
jgi:pimeloyl-ACP methyl ester carboxylesterase